MDLGLTENDVVESSCLASQVVHLVLGLRRSPGTAFRSLVHVKSCQEIQESLTLDLDMVLSSVSHPAELSKP